MGIEAAPRTNHVMPISQFGEGHSDGAFADSLLPPINSTPTRYSPPVRPLFKKDVLPETVAQNLAQPVLLNESLSEKTLPPKPQQARGVWSAVKQVARELGKYYITGGWAKDAVVIATQASHSKEARVASHLVKEAGNSFTNLPYDVVEVTRQAINTQPSRQAREAAGELVTAALDTVRPLFVAPTPIYDKGIQPRAVSQDERQRLIAKMRGHSTTASDLGVPVRDQQFVKEQVANPVEAARPEVTQVRRDQLIRRMYEPRPPVLQERIRAPQPQVEKPIPSINDMQWENFLNSLEVTEPVDNYLDGPINFKIENIVEGMSLALEEDNREYFNQIVENLLIRRNEYTPDELKQLLSVTEQFYHRFKTDFAPDNKVKSGLLNLGVKLGLLYEENQIDEVLLQKFRDAVEVRTEGGLLRNYNITPTDSYPDKVFAMVSNGLVSAIAKKDNVYFNMVLKNIIVKEKYLTADELQKITNMVSMYEHQFMHGIDNDTSISGRMFRAARALGIIDVQIDNTLVEQLKIILAEKQLLQLPPQQEQPLIISAVKFDSYYPDFLMEKLGLSEPDNILLRILTPINASVSELHIQENELITRLNQNIGREFITPRTNLIGAREIGNAFLSWMQLNNIPLGNVVEGSVLSNYQAAALYEELVDMYYAPSHLFANAYDRLNFINSLFPKYGFGEIDFAAGTENHYKIATLINTVKKDAAFARARTSDDGRKASIFDYSEFSALFSEEVAERLLLQRGDNSTVASTLSQETIWWYMLQVLSGRSRSRV